MWCSRSSFLPVCGLNGSAAPWRGGMSARTAVWSRSARFAKCAPGETIPSFHVEATGVQVGEHKIRVVVTSQLSPQGVVAEETTSVTAQ